MNKRIKLLKDSRVSSKEQSVHNDTQSNQGKKYKASTIKNFIYSSKGRSSPLKSASRV
jgi:hypothetical protein